MALVKIAGMRQFDPSQRIKGYVRGMSLAVPQEPFRAMVANMDRSLLMTGAVDRLLGGP